MFPIGAPHQTRTSAATDSESCTVATESNIACASSTVASSSVYRDPSSPWSLSREAALSDLQQSLFQEPSRRSGCHTPTIGTLLADSDGAQLPGSASSAPHSHTHLVLARADRISSNDSDANRSSTVWNSIRRTSTVLIPTPNSIFDGLAPGAAAAGAAIRGANRVEHGFPSYFCAA